MQLLGKPLRLGERVFQHESFKLFVEMRYLSFIAGTYNEANLSYRSLP